jgi:hypothetical protein
MERDFNSPSDQPIAKGCVPIWRVGTQAQSIATGGNLSLIVLFV